MDLRSVQQTDHRLEPAEVHRLGELGGIDLFAGRAVQVEDLEADTGGLDKGLAEGSHGDIVDLADGSLNVLRAIALEIGWNVVLILVGA